MTDAHHPITDDPQRRSLAPPPSARAVMGYVFTVILAGAAVLAVVAAHRWRDLLHQPAVVWLLAGGVLAGELRPIQIRRAGSENEMTPSTTFGFALVLVAGPTALLIQVLASVTADVVSR